MVQRQPQALGSHVEENRTVIGAQTEIRGSIAGTGELRIHGSVEGDLRLRGIVHVEEGGLLRGDTQATQIFVDGIVVGDLQAEISIVLRPSARVVGSLIAPRMEVMEGAQFRGPIRTQAAPAAEVMVQQDAKKKEESPSRASARSGSRAVAPRSASKRRAANRSSTHQEPAQGEATVVVSQPETQNSEQNAEQKAKASADASQAVAPKIPSRGKKRAQRRETNA